MERLSSGFFGGRKPSTGSLKTASFGAERKRFFAQWMDVFYMIYLYTYIFQYIFLSDVHIYNIYILSILIIVF